MEESGGSSVRSPLRVKRDSISARIQVLLDQREEIDKQIKEGAVQGAETAYKSVPGLVADDPPQLSPSVAPGGSYASVVAKGVSRPDLGGRRIAGNSGANKDMPNTEATKKRRERCRKSRGESWSPLSHLVPSKEKGKKKARRGGGGEGRTSRAAPRWGPLPCRIPRCHPQLRLRPLRWLPPHNRRGRSGRRWEGRRGREVERLGESGGVPPVEALMNNGARRGDLPVGHKTPWRFGIRDGKGEP